MANTYTYIQLAKRRNNKKNLRWKPTYDHIPQVKMPDFASEYPLDPSIFKPGALVRFKTSNDMDLIYYYDLVAIIWQPIYYEDYFAREGTRFWTQERDLKPKEDPVLSTVFHDGSRRDCGDPYFYDQTNGLITSCPWEDK